MNFSINRAIKNYYEEDYYESFKIACNYYSLNYPIFLMEFTSFLKLYIENILSRGVTKVSKYWFTCML